VTVDDPFVALKRAVDNLQGKANVIVLLSTCGDAYDSSFASQNPAIILIIGGRSFRPNIKEPCVIGSTRIVRAPHDGRAMGRMDLEFGTKNALKTFSPIILPMETSGKSDAKMLQLVKQYIPTFVDNPTEGVMIAQK
jgi:2',3'-cyclic-nucleotide 2'-phosphodiesterase (5'-nucleotidase family)